MKSNNPELRFKEFKDEWKKVKLRNLTERVRGNDGRMDLPTLTISAANGWLDQKDRFSGNIAGKEQKNYTLLKKGELSYNHGNSKLAKYGMVFVLKNFKEALVPRIYHSFKTTNEASPYFIEAMFATKKPDKELGKLISSGARMDGLLNINYEDFVGINITVPKIDEQNKIGDFILSLESTINLSQQELDALKQTKQGFLQKMLPNVGESLPEIRFSGYVGDWVQSKLGEISNIITGSTPSTANKDYYHGEFLFVSPADIQGNRYVEATNTTLKKSGFEKGRKIKSGSTLFVSIGSTIGKVAQVSREVITNQQINSVIPNIEMDKDFVFSLLEKNSKIIKKLSATQAVPIINKSTFSNINVMHPTLEEQIKIGKFFRQLDEVIDLKGQELEALKQTKKGFLQKMFV